MGLGNFLIRDDTQETGKRQTGLILMGNLVARAEHAATLWHQGLVDTLVFFEVEADRLQEKGWVASDANLTRRLLQDLGVPPENILSLRGEKISTSTFDEAANLLAWLRNQKEHSEEVLIITSWYHTSRAGWIFEKVFSEEKFRVRMAPAPSPGVSPSRWWQSEQAFLNVFEEYLKWAYYLYRYGLA